MGVTCPDLPPPQDSPPPRDSSPSQDKKSGSTVKVSHPKVKHVATSWQLSGPLRQLLSSSDLEATVHDSFTEDGRERVVLVRMPLDDLLPNKSPTLISLVTLWVNVLLRKAVRIKHWSWAYVLRILNNEAASVTFDELFRESIHCSQGDMTTQVFLSVLQNESLQDELFNFLREFVQKLVAKGDAIQLHKLKNLGLTVSSSVMESSELRVEFESFTRVHYERVLQECTTPDSSDEPPHLTAYLTILLDDDDVSERLPTGCSDGECQPTSSSVDDPPPSSRKAESISKVQSWLSQSDATFSSSGTESDCQNQRMSNKGKGAFKQRQGNAIFRDISSSGSDSEQVGRHGFTNPTRSFSTVAGTSETFDILPSRTNIIHRESMKSTNELLPPGDPSNIQPRQTDLSTPLSTESSEGRSSTSSSEGGMTSLEADDSSDGGSEGVLPKTKCRAPVEEGGVSTYRKSNGEANDKKLPASAQESVETQHLITERENANDTIVMSLRSAPQPPQLWCTEVLQNSSNLDSLKTFILSLPAEVLVLKDAVQGKTLCHALVGWVNEQFSSADIAYLLGLLGKEFLQQCMVCQDFSGNTPLHCAVEARTHGVVMFLLRFATCESVMILNNDGLTALELSFEKKLWSITQLLIEHQIETGASCAAELLQEYFFKVMKEQGGTDFLPRLLGLKEHYCLDLDLNFSESRSSRTPWWYLAHSSSSETSVVGRVLRTLKDHSIEFESLKIRSGHGKNLVEEAEARNKVLHTVIQTVTKCQQSEELQPPPNALPGQTGSSPSTESSSSGSSLEGGMTSLKADDSSDGGSEGLLSKTKRSTKRTHKKTIPAVQQCCPITGREVQFDITKPSAAASLEARLGKSSVFPRLEVVQQLELAFLKDPRTPSDVQILRGSLGVNPSEPLVDFIHSFHDAFKGGIFWINGRRQEFVDASAAYITKATGTVPTGSQTHPVLVIFAHIDQMPQFSDPSTSLVDLLRHPNTHIVVISKNYTPPDALLREIDHQLLRGCNIIDMKPLSPIHTTQRIVHSILSAHHLAPTNEDQNIFEKLAQFTSGSPALIDVTAALFLSQMEHDSQNVVQDVHDTLINLNDQLSLDGVGPSTKPVTIVRPQPPKGTVKTRKISKNVYDNIISIRDPQQNPWCTRSPYDSWQAVTTLIDQCSLSGEEKLLLFAVSMFSCSPIPMSMVTEISSMIAKASHKQHISTSLHSKLFQMQLMKRYPLPVILHPSLGVQQPSAEPEIVYVPQYIAQAIWKDMMSDNDKVMALTTMYMALRTLADNLSSSNTGFLAGLTSLLVERYELNYELMGTQCYQEVYKLYLQIGGKLTERKQQLIPPLPPQPSPQPPPQPSPPLAEEDLVDIISYLFHMNKRAICDLGLVLGLTYHKLKDKMDSDTFLKDVIHAWLQREDQVDKKGKPSWEVLIRALRHPMVGQRGIANDIAKDKDCSI